LKNYDKDDLEFMSSLSNAVLKQTEQKTKILLNIVIISMIWLIIWANFAEIDEITRGEGKVIPSSKIQVIQNLEGGLISDIMVDIGVIVKKGDDLLKIENKKDEGTFNENRLRIDELEAKAVRLYAQAHDKKFSPADELTLRAPKLVENEKKLMIDRANEIIKDLDIEIDFLETLRKRVANWNKDFGQKYIELEGLKAKMLSNMTKLNAH